jgi:hypothetical protein
MSGIAKRAFDSFTTTQCTSKRQRTSGSTSSMCSSKGLPIKAVAVVVIVAINLDDQCSTAVPAIGRTSEV